MRERLWRVMATLFAIVIVVASSPMMTLAQESDAVYISSQQTKRSYEETTQTGLGEKSDDTDAEGDDSTLPTATTTADSGETADLHLQKHWMLCMTKKMQVRK